MIHFYKKVMPGGLWRPIRGELKGADSKTKILPDIINWLLGTILVYSALFGIGKVILLELKMGIVYLIISVISALLLYKNTSKRRIYT